VKLTAITITDAQISDVLATDWRIT